MKITDEELRRFVKAGDLTASTLARELLRVRGVTPPPLENVTVEFTQRELHLLQEAWDCLAPQYAAVDNADFNDRLKINPIEADTLYRKLLGM